MDAYTADRPTSAPRTMRAALVPFAQAAGPGAFAQVLLSRS